MALLIQRRWNRVNAEDNVVHRHYRPRVNPLTLYTDREFQKRYRLPKRIVVQLGILLKRRGFKAPLLQLPFQRRISAVLTVCVGLRFLATGSMYRDVGDAHHVAQSSVCRCVRKTLNLLLAIQERHMSFPIGREAFQEKADEFAAIADFPHVVGAVDGTHVGVRPPANEERSFRNRKGTYSINVQVMCDANLMFMDCDARWPGSCHDSSIWKNSEIGKTLQAVNFLQPFYILGDSGYPLRPWLLTPYLQPNTPRQREYNSAHCRTRNTVERSIGLLKIRFRVLDKTGGVIQSPPATASQIINACMVLHNIAIRARMNLDINEEDDEEGHANDDLQRLLEGDVLVGDDDNDGLHLDMNDANDRERNRQGQRIRNLVALHF